MRRAALRLLTLTAAAVIGCAIPSCGDDHPTAVTSAVASPEASTGSHDGGAGDLDEEAPTDGPCAAFCAVLAGTDCPPDPSACPAACEAQLVDVCGDEARASFACEAGLTASDYTCDDRGRLVLNPGKCQAENDALVSCFSQ